jgi:hypothetical protein
MKTLIYGDSLSDCLNNIDNTHLESYYGITTSQMVKDEENGIGLSLFLSEDLEYINLILIVGTNDIISEEESILNIQKLLINVKINVIIISKFIIPNYNCYNFYNIKYICDDNVHFNYDGKIKFIEFVKKLI